MRLIDGDELYQKVVGYNGGAVDKTVAKRLIDQMPTVNHADVVSRKTFEQIKWERDTAVKQLEELGYGLGEKIRTCKTCRYNYLEWHEEPCDSCTSGGESNHWKPSEQPEIIRCEDCRWGREACGNIECFADTNVPPEYHGYEWFCPNGERRTDE